MKSTVAALTGLMAVANAYQPRNFHWRRNNDTAYAAPTAASSSAISSAISSAPLTTLTVEVTEVATITSCKPTITDCPAAVESGLPEDELDIILVTKTRVLTEIVCPVSEAEQLESSIVEKHESSVSSALDRTVPASAPYPTLTVPVDVPLTTGGSIPVETSASASIGGDLTTEVSEIETTATLTLTLGVGSSASVIETVITSAFETTITRTVTASLPEDEETTTTTATTTGTKTVTVDPEATAVDNSPVGDESVPGYGSIPAECPTVSVVTVTLPAETVFVTIGGDKPVPTAPSDNGDGPKAEETGDESPVADDEDEEYADEDVCDEDVEDEDVEDEDSCEDEEPVTVSQTVTVEPVPFPTGSTNGTLPSGVPAPTGSYPVPTGYALRYRNAN